MAVFEQSRICIHEDMCINVYTRKGARHISQLSGPQLGFQNRGQKYKMRKQISQHSALQSKAQNLGLKDEMRNTHACTGLHTHGQG